MLSGFFDIETFEIDDSGQLRSMLCCFYFEALHHGRFFAISFGHRFFEHRLLNCINTNVFSYDYLGKDLPNSLETTKVSKRMKNKYRDPLHYSLEPESYEWLKQDIMREVDDYLKGYADNIKRFDFVKPSVKMTPMFHFLCFILNPKHQNRAILSHYGKLQC